MTFKDISFYHKNISIKKTSSPVCGDTRDYDFFPLNHAVTGIGIGIKCDLSCQDFYSGR